MTGSEARVPDAGYWTNREATTLSEVPERVVILGGGPVGVERGQFMRRLGADGHRVVRLDDGSEAYLEGAEKLGL